MKENSSLTPEEVANILKVAKTTVYSLIKRGELNAYRIGRKVRVEQHDVDEYIRKGKNPSNNTNSEILNISHSTEEKLSKINYNQLSSNSNNRGFLICGQDILLDILSRYLEQHPNGTKTVRSYIGSYRSLINLYEGEAQVATCHLWDGRTGDYNTPYVKRLLPGTPAIIIHLACRMQGFYVQNGNPKEIKSWEDLKRNDITIINREKGSGTRILLDEHLKLLGITGNTINGYSLECLTHLAAASAVARGKADLALGNEKTGLQVNGIDFIPLQNERYDLVIKKEDMSKPPFQALIEIIRSEEFKIELEGIGGYDLSETGKIIAET